MCLQMDAVQTLHHSEQRTVRWFSGTAHVQKAVILLYFDLKLFL